MQTQTMVAWTDDHTASGTTVARELVLLQLRVTRTTWRWPDVVAWCRSLGMEIIAAGQPLLTLQLANEPALVEQMLGRLAAIGDILALERSGVLMLPPVADGGPLG